MDNNSLTAFVVAALVVLLIPGPGVLYVVTRSLMQGRGAGLISVLGLSVGALVHVIATTAGLSAILVTSATLFGIVKTLGACYLIYLGLHILMTRQRPTEADTVPIPSSRTRLFIDGVIVSVFNPKIAIFFLAFLPQFTDPNRGSVAQQLLFLGVLYVVLAFCTDGAYALLASKLRNLSTGRFLQIRFLRYTSGLVFVGLGVSLALSDTRRT